MALADFQRIDHFGDPAAEATACRRACALFAFSFLESTQVHGDGARQAVEAFTGRSIARLPIGQICYALRVAATGHVIADLTIWRTGVETFEVMSGRREDVADLAAGAVSGVTVIQLDDRAVLALQGPPRSTFCAVSVTAMASKLCPISGLSRHRSMASPAGSAGLAIPASRDSKSFVPTVRPSASGRSSRFTRDRLDSLPLICSASKPALYYSATNSACQSPQPKRGLANFIKPPRRHAGSSSSRLWPMQIAWSGLGNLAGRFCGRRALEKSL